MADLDWRLAPERLLRVVRRQVKRAEQALAPRWPPRDAAVHEARKRLKKARAALRLARPALGERRYARDNQRLRDAARPLGAVRDAAMLMTTWKRMLRGRARPPAARIVREALLAHDHSVRRRSLGGPAHQAIEQALRAARRDAGASVSAGSDPIAGLTRIYRRGRKALAAARENPTPVRLHEWRKQTKYLWNALDIIGAGAMRDRGALARAVHRLSNMLGGLHDLHVLHTRIADPRVPLEPSDRRAILALLDARILARSQRALREGATIYRRRPRAILRRRSR